MKKIIVRTMSLMLAAGLMTGCGATSKGAQGITVISREEGSGTRGAFVELFKIEEKDASGNKVDQTTEEAIISNSTSVMMTTVQNDEAAIGYISLGSLNDTVKAAQIDGTAATMDNIKSGTYKIARPFNIVVKEGLSEPAQDFMNFILSEPGQKVVEEAGYISVEATGDFNSAKPSGKIVVAGSSSVTPVMEKIKEAYKEVNPNATVEIQESDSTTGITSTIDGICDIGMASRAVKDSEKQSGLTATQIALDGIAVIMNNNNPVEDLTSDKVKGIFTGEILNWDDVQ